MERKYLTKCGVSVVATLCVWTALLSLDKAQAAPTEHAFVPNTSEQPTLAKLISDSKVKIDSVGTGETIGHVADLKIQNLTDQPLTCAIPPMILESGSGKNQHYACPIGQTVGLNPQQTKTVPINGVCLNRNKPPVGKGVSGDLVMNEANPTAPQNPNSHLSATDANKLLRSCAAKYTAADQLQKSGALKALPYHDPQKQKDIVVQWSTWCDPRISEITGAPPATKDDLKKVVYKQVEEQGPMSPEKKKKVDQGIDTIFEKVELTSAKAKDLEKPGPVFTGPISTEKPRPVFGEPVSSSEKAGPLFQPATVAQPGDVVHVEPQSPRDHDGAAAATGAKGHWMVKVKLPSGKVVEVWFETDEKPPLEVCNWIKINKTGTSAGGKETVVKDYEKTTAPTPTAKPTSPPPTTASTPTATIAPTATPPPTPAPTPTATQPPQLPGGKTEAEKPKDEVAKPPSPWEPPFELPEWLRENPVWIALKAAVPGSEFAEALPGGKAALFGLITQVKNEMLEECKKPGHNEEKCEYYEKLHEKLTRIYNNMPDE